MHARKLIHAYIRILINASSYTYAHTIHTSALPQARSLFLHLGLLGFD